jgi:hypothetical protein
MDKDTHDLRTKQAVFLQLLRDDHPEQWSRADLERELLDVDPQAIGGALAFLVAEGVAIVDGEHVRASRSARCISALEMICV